MVEPLVVGDFDRTAHGIVRQCDTDPHLGGLGAHLAADGERRQDEHGPVRVLGDGASPLQFDPRLPGAAIREDAAPALPQHAVHHELLVVAQAGGRAWRGRVEAGIGHPRLLPREVFGVVHLGHDVVSCSARRRFASTSRANFIAIQAFADSVVEHAGGKRAGRHVADSGERAQAEPRRRLDSDVYLISHGSG